jgi:hypothetical protein
VPPLEFSAARQQRVRFALRRSRAGLAALRLSPALALGVVVLAATGASAMVARYFVRTHLRAPEITLPTAELNEAAPRPNHRARGATVEAPAVAEPATTDAPAAQPDPVPKAEPAARANLSRSRAAAPAPTTPSAQSPGAALMLEAMQARKAGDMARAASLLAEYRSKYPDGDLQEEALALSIEAAAARHDGSAQGFAAQYLKRFPNGRFREQAERALQSNPR